MSSRHLAERKFPPGGILSANGFKSKEWGSMFWIIYHQWTRALQQSCSSCLLLLFFFSPGFLLPCVYCRHSYVDFVSLRENDGRRHLRKQAADRSSSLDTCLRGVHHCVNKKLDKSPASDRDVRKIYECDWRPWFWDWLFLLALNFPLNVSAEVREHDRDVSRRYRTYVLFFDALKNLIPDERLRRGWTRVYVRHPLDFASRTALVASLYDVYVRVLALADVPASRIPSMEAALTKYEKLRASSCAVTNAEALSQAAASPKGMSCL